MDFSPEEIKRYARHFALPQVGELGQKKLKNSRVLVVGAGGLGSPVTLYLAAAGVGHIGIVDHNSVSLENLQRQVLYTTSDVSQSKVTQAKNHLSKLNPHIEISTINDKFNHKTAENLVANYDIIIDGTDNFETRYIVNEACVLKKKPLIFGAIYRFDGQVSVFAAADGPCYVCVYPSSPEAEAMPNCSEAGVLGVLPGVVGTLMATEALKIILGIGDILIGRMLVYDALKTQFQNLKISKRVDCKVCGTHGIKKLSDSRPPSEVEISAQDLKGLLSNAKPYLIDVRSEEEFADFHLPGSKNIPLNQFTSRLDTIPAEDQLILICQTGVRSARALEIMRSNGRTNVFQLSGGLNSLTPSLKAGSVENAST